jgi:hypothetical protein
MSQKRSLQNCRRAVEIWRSARRKDPFFKGEKLLERPFCVVAARALERRPESAGRRMCVVQRDERRALSFGPWSFQGPFNVEQNEGSREAAKADLRPPRSGKARCGLSGDTPRRMFLLTP